MNQEYYIGQIFEGKYPPSAACWCNANNAYIDVIGDKVYEIKAVPEPPAPTHEEIRQMRATAYQQEVDPLTCHIGRLRDEEQTEEVQEEIAALIEERTAKIEEIKERYPYPDEPEPEPEGEDDVQGGVDVQ